MILSAPVSFKLAKLLKRKKYKNTTPNKLRRNYYNYLGILNGDMTEYITAYIAKNKKDIRRFTTIDAPTIGEVVDWLFEEHLLWISVDYNPENGQYFYCIRRKLYRLKLNNKTIYYNHDSLIELYEAAITYCLNKLIKNGKKI